MAASPQPANALAEAEGGSGAGAAFRPGFSTLEPEPEPPRAGPAPPLLHCRESGEGVCEELFLLGLSLSSLGQRPLFAPAWSVSRALDKGKRKRSDLCVNRFRIWAIMFFSALTVLSFTGVSLICSSIHPSHVGSNKVVFRMLAVLIQIRFLLES